MFVRARLNSVNPYLPVSVCYVLCYEVVECAQVRVSGVRGAESVSLSDKSSGVVRKVGSKVGDTSLGDKVSGCGEECLAELGLPGTA